MSKHAAKALAASVVFSITAMCAAEAPEQATLKRARELVNQKDYTAALEQYDKIAEWLWRDPGLVIERARVYTYADRHAEAIELFEQVLSKFPDQANVFAKELENQRSYIILQRAQNLIEQERYAEALKEYDKIAQWMQKNPDLLIELARVHTYANRHADAIRLFELVREGFPDFESQIILELGRQYTWNKQISAALVIFRRALDDDPNNIEYRMGLALALVWDKQYAEALAEYDVILRDNPKSVPALLGKANALSWNDRLEQANVLYERVIQIDPGNLSAMNGQARLEVWDGHHRRGADAYRGILQKHPENLDALEGLAFSLHWDDRSREAVDVLRTLKELRPDRREAAKLMYEIQYAQNPYVSQYNDFSRNNDGRRIQTHGMIVGVPIDYDTLLEAIYEYQRIWDNDDGTVNAHRSGVGIHRRLGQFFKVDSYMYGTIFDRRGWEVFTTDTKLTWLPDDLWRVKVGYDRDTFRDVKAIREKIVVDSWSTAVAHRPNRFWLFAGKFKQGFYSDDNRQDSVLVKIEYRLLHKPYLKFYYNFYFSNWRKRLTNGYFNPKRFRSHTLGLFVSKKIGQKLYVDTQASIGYEVHTPIVRSPTIFFAHGVRYLLSENWAVRARVEMFKAMDDKRRHHHGYSNTQVMLSLVYFIGGKPQQAPQPYDTAREPRPEAR